ncbi:MAG TPA: HEAT repeat domain-containing protein [Candidatus Sulfotelmatobacter sp.]
MRAVNQIGRMSSAEVANALPSIISAFEFKDDTVKGYAALAMFAIGQRPDGATLLRPDVQTIGRGLESPNVHLQGATLQLLAMLMLKPEPQSEAASLLQAFVKRTDRNPIAQADAMSFLLRLAPDNPDLTPTLQKFLARPMDEQTTIAVINGISNSHTENSVATDMLIRSLEDPSEQIRFQAAQGFQEMPKDMITRAKPVLQSLLDRPDESQEVKDAAKEALRRSEPQG